MPRTILQLASLVLALTASAPPTSFSHAKSLTVTGQAGYLGEWELTADVAETLAPGKREYHGALTMKHVGMCTQDGPEVRTGEISLRLSNSGALATALLLLDGTACSFSGRKDDAYHGVMSCPDRREVPLLLWLK